MFPMHEMFVFIDNGACWAHTFHAKWWLMRCCRALKPSAPSCWCSLPSLLSSAAAPSSSTTSGSGTPALQQMLWRTAQAMIALHCTCCSRPQLHRTSRLVKTSVWNEFAHIGQDEIVAILQTTVSNTFLWMKMYWLRLKFHWSLFIRVQLPMFQHWFK